MSAPIVTGLLRIMALLSHWPPLCTCHTYCSYVHISITAVQRTKQLGRPCYHTIPASVIIRSSPQMLQILRPSLSLSTLSRNPASLQRYCTNWQINYAAIDGPHSRARTPPSTASQLLFPHRVPVQPPALKVANPERTDMRFPPLRVQVRTHYQYLGHTLSAYVHMHTLI